MHTVWFYILVGSWGLGMVLAAAESGGTIKESIRSVIRNGEGFPALQGFCLLTFLAITFFLLLIWPLLKVAELFTKPEESER